MRIIFLGDKIFGGSSAYTRVCYETATRLAKLGHKIGHSPMGISNLMGKWDFKDILIFQSGVNPWGEDVALENYLDFKADMLITLKEVWVFNTIPHLPINWVPMCPIDHEPVSMFITSKLHTAFNVIAISRHGQRELKNSGINSVYIPHGVDVDTFKPLESKAECKKSWYLDEDDFTVGIVAMNRARKMIDRQLRGYKRFLELNPDVKSHLVLWTNVEGESAPEEARYHGVADVGVHLLPEIYRLGLGDRVRWTKWKEVRKMGGLPDWAPSGSCMVRLYNAMDALLNCTGGEGAGLTQLEALACGVTPITTDYAGGPEYVGSGLVVPPSDYIIFDTPGSRYALADMDKMAEALTRICNADPEKLKCRARNFAEKLSWEKIINDYWKPFLEEAEVLLHPKITSQGASSWAA